MHDGLMRAYILSKFRPTNAGIMVVALDFSKGTLPCICADEFFRVEWKGEWKEWAFPDAARELKSG
jgi:glycerol-3-phosphate acyltransferase PlsY